MNLDIITTHIYIYIFYTEIKIENFYKLYVNIMNINSGKLHEKENINIHNKCINLKKKKSARFFGFCGSNSINF